MPLPNPRRDSCLPFWLFGGGKVARGVAYFWLILHYPLDEFFTAENLASVPQTLSVTLSGSRKFIQPNVAATHHHHYRHLNGDQRSQHNASHCHVRHLAS
ncbi:hypothetical protein C8Q76DRAFT_717037 [Earliella scabrosa]|nr:hypothetical protein C8Q76DRAFT_717037 [Earliella scabrosa]